MAPRRARGSHAILKPARIGSKTPWHQDEAYWDPAANYLSLSVWLPLQEATPENGCMYFIPRSHESDVRPHHHIDNNPKIHGLEIDDGQFNMNTAVACPLPAGGATFHYSRTCHYTPPNVSDEDRRAFVLTFAIDQLPPEMPRDFYWQRETRTYAATKREVAARRRQR
ncbi:MAG: phytanoyl-CoA dioxygenase family protein [Candidatus Latescibacterota bacterium]|nr:phytanoyl-CoA dioxygenase family protein [Candidatus Latescibacterota bacterium]